MNRIALLCTLGFIVGLVADATEIETWTYMGPEFSFAYESQGSGTEKVSSSMRSMGANLTVFTFRDRKDVGFYVHDSFLFPQTGKISQGGESASVDLSIYDFLMSVEMILGPGFRIQRNADSYFAFGFGLHFMQLSGYYEKYVFGYGTVSYSILAYNFGIGGEFVSKIDLNDKAFFVAGVSASYDPFNVTTVTVGGESVTGNPTDYSYFSFRPYLGLGINTFQTRSRLGKPGED